MLTAISNLLLHVNIDIILFQTVSYSSFNVDKLQCSKYMMKIKIKVKIAKIAFLGDYCRLRQIFT